MSGEDRKPDVTGGGGVGGSGEGDESNMPIQIRVRCANYEEVQFKIKKRTALSKVMDAFCSKTSIERDSLVFLFDGKRIPKDANALDMDLEDDDV